MKTAHEALRAAGITAASDAQRSGLRAECAGLARRIREIDVRIVGLVPADDGVAVPAVAVELGRALAEVSVGLVGVLDGDGSWPCAAELAREGGGTRRAETSWLADNLALLTPRGSGAETPIERLRGVLDEEAGAFHHVVVDLTGFDHLGEHLAACAAVDGFAVVARSGRTTSAEIERWRRDLSGRRALGVLLTGL